MKKSKIPILIFLFSSILVFGQELKNYHINNAIEFANAIGSNRNIFIDCDSLDFSTVITDGENYKIYERYHSLTGEFERSELNIMNVNNLKIIGNGSEPANISTKPELGHVIVFSDCMNITIENVNAGHWPEKGACMGGVFLFRNSSQIEINHSIMYGSGVRGILAYNVNELKCKNSTIKECTTDIFDIEACSEIDFENCVFENNDVAFDFMNIRDCINVRLTNCSIYNNRAYDWDENETTLLKVTGSLGVSLHNCQFQGNSVAYFAQNNKSFELNDCKLINNQFSQGNFKE